MKNKIFYISVFCSFFACFVQADNIGMGKWRMHLAYNSVGQIAQSDKKIYAVSDGALFSVDKIDGSMEFYSKISGLHDTSVSRIEYDQNTRQLLVIYANGNIDFINEGGVINLPDLYNKQMTFSKDVQHITFFGNRAYLSCHFGIVALNMVKKEIAETYFIGADAAAVDVLCTTVHGQTIYALSKSAVYKADVTNPYLVNYEVWSTVANLPGSGNFQSVVSFANQLFLLRNGKIYQMNAAGQWSPFLSQVTASNLLVSDGSLFILSTNNNIYLLDNQLVSKTISGLGAVADAEYDSENNTCWFAANGNGIISYRQEGSLLPVVSTYKPSGPAVNIPWQMRFSGQKLFVVPGGRSSAQYNQQGYVMMFENGVWTNIDGKTIETQTGKRVLDFMDIAVDPNDPTHFLVPSYGTGIYEFKNNQFSKWYNFTNSLIETIFPNDPNGSYLYMRMDGGVFDSEGNVWFTNTRASYGIKILKPDGQWTQLAYAGITSRPTLGQILIPSLNPNQKWILSVRSEPGICVIDDNGTIDDQRDDKSVFFPYFRNTDEAASNIAPTLYNCMVEDKNHVIWVGTDMGPLLFYNPSNAFDADFTCSRVKIPRNDGTNLADYLLADETIQAIAVDGANRKWIGTKSSGVYLMSENGQETLQHFTVSNSPLLSNNIMSIAINPVSGEVYFGTGKGIVSYQSDAAEAGSSFGDVHAYPNPVRETYNGVITITGLMENTHIKITDLNGNLVYETTSNGSLATWNGKNLHGQKVSTGIYLVIGASKDGTQSTITKILVIN
ncbi:MAG TPA: T9SS type A sorting domain-containing protein [Paludibacteraceae bacterium]|nr:T9SS type A sorting domain-containing protein [Paludibacteraceae bacterium]